ncbi:MAG: glycosyltransferase family 4 protein [Chthoniobacterales bacterium]|nr:glycosyltransferase family 4 protein [Chthoniobacterales bacterium]
MPAFLNTATQSLYLGLPRGQNFGWGTCSHYLKTELRRLYPRTFLLEDLCTFEDRKFLDGTIFNVLKDVNFEPLYKARGIRNFGYAVFEQELNSNSIQNAKNFDCIFCGSSWNLEKLKAAGIPNCLVLLHGVDGKLFSYSEPNNRDSFVIFSGGKFEFRKAQDVVIRAVSIFQKRHKEVLFVNAWHNPWPQTMVSMANSRWISCEFRGTHITEILKNILAENGVDLQRTIVLGEVPNDRMREVYQSTDIGLFPNRCEGATNLVLMEYMACGRPAIATYATGQRDVLTEESAFLLRENQPLQMEQDGKLIADWVEPSLEEILAHLEFAFTHRDVVRQKGLAASQQIKRFTWEAAARTVLAQL